MSKLRIVVNPAAGKGRAVKLLPVIEQELKQFPLEYEICLTEYPWHAAKLAEEAVTLGYDVVAAGGDGTANEVLNGIMLARNNGLGTTRMGVLPIGRGNDFGFSMGIPAEPKEACRVLAEGKTRWIDIGLVKGGLYPQGRYFGNGVGIGFDAVVGFVAAELPLSGFPAYLAATVKTMMLYYHAPLMEITLDGQTFQKSCLMVSVMNGYRLGGGFYMTPESKPDDQTFDLCIAGKISRTRILRIIPSFFNGTQGRWKRDISFHRSSKITVRSLDGALPTHADGETICVDGNELSIEILPKQIELITGVSGNMS